MGRSNNRRALWFAGALALVGCTSLTAVDWSLVDDQASGGRGGSSGADNTAGTSDGMGGNDEGDGGQDAAGGASGGEGDGGSSGAGGGSGAGGTTAGSGGTTAGTGGTTAGTGGTTAGTGGTTAGTGGTTAGSAGSAGSAGTGGTGFACGDGFPTGDDTPLGSECEPPSSVTCSNDCVRIATPACYQCEQDGACYEYSESCIANTTNSLDQANCFNVQECITTSNCGDGMNTLTSCFCGALSTADCIAAPSSGVGAPAGPCAAEIRTAMGGAATTNAQVLTRYINIAFPGGAALARYNCTKLAPVCTAVCGF